MEREANYVAVGAFILLVIGMAVAFIIWYTDSNDGRKYTTYEIGFAGSVSGLDQGSPVRYLGVDVGRVRRLNIDPEDASRVQIFVEVDQSAPISSATRASLGLQGVTGLLYVNLKEVADVDKDQPLRQGDRYPVIESVASDFDTFLASLPELMGRATSLLERVGRIVSDRNLEALATSLGNVRTATAELPGAAREFGQMVEQMNGTMKEIRSAAADVKAVTGEARPQISATLLKVTEAAEHLAQVSQRIDRFTQKTDGQVGNFTEQGLFELQRLMRETRSAAREFRELSQALKDNPSQILYEPVDSGVAIKR
jgi:phospholipid/cholesterol/gamma-HCH transport system substrate-binding protein